MAKMKDGSKIEMASGNRRKRIISNNGDNWP
jgi:hypothetical protein